MRVILATGSPYRRDTFSILGIPFESESSSVDEDSEGRPEDPGELVKELSRLKAEDIASRRSQGIVIGFDSVGFFRGRVMEKPRDREEASQRLRDLSGQGFRFFTGVHMIDASSGRALSRIVETDVEMRELSEEEIIRYLDQDPKFTTYALGFDPLKHYSSTFAKSIRGSYYNLTQGLPMETIVDMLKEIGYNQ